MTWPQTNAHSWLGHISCYSTKKTSSLLHEAGVYTNVTVNHNDRMLPIATVIFIATMYLIYTVFFRYQLYGSLLQATAEMTMTFRDQPGQCHFVIIMYDFLLVFHSNYMTHCLYLAMFPLSSKKVLRNNNFSFSVCYNWVLVSANKRVFNMHPSSLSDFVTR